MTIGKGTRLEMVIKEIQAKLEKKLKSCLVTNERGLIVAASGTEQNLSERLAAMISLASDSAQRISENIGIKSTRSVKIMGAEGMFIVYEFPVHGRRFRMGALFEKSLETSEGRIRSIFRKKRTVDQILADAASKIQRILEE